MGDVDLDIARFDGQLAALGHGVACVDCEVEDDLNDLRGVGHHRAELRVESGHELDVFTDHAPEHLLDVGDRGV